MRCGILVSSAGFSELLLLVAHQDRLECSAKCNRGVNEAFTEAARVALSVKTSGSSGRGRRCVIM